MKNYKKYNNNNNNKTIDGLKHQLEIKDKELEIIRLQKQMVENSLEELKNKSEISSIIEKEDKYNELEVKYNELKTKYNELYTNNNELKINYNELETKYNNLYIYNQNLYKAKEEKDINMLVYQNTDMSPREFITYCVLRNMANSKTNICFPSIDTIAKLIKCKRTQTKSVLHSLEQKGLLVITVKAAKYYGSVTNTFMPIIPDKIKQMYEDTKKAKILDNKVTKIQKMSTDKKEQLSSSNNPKEDVKADGIVDKIKTFVENNIANSHKNEKLKPITIDELKVTYGYNELISDCNNTVCEVDRVFNIMLEMLNTNSYIRIGFNKIHVSKLRETLKDITPDMLNCMIYSIRRNIEEHKVRNILKFTQACILNCKSVYIDTYKDYWNKTHIQTTSENEQNMSQYANTYNPYENNMPQYGTSCYGHAMSQNSDNLYGDIMSKDREDKYKNETPLERYERLVERDKMYEQEHYPNGYKSPYAAKNQFHNFPQTYQSKEQIDALTDLLIV